MSHLSALFRNYEVLLITDTWFRHCIKDEGDINQSMKVVHFRLRLLPHIYTRLNTGLIAKRSLVKINLISHMVWG